MINYAKKYGLKTFEEEPFQVLDGLILCQMAYYRYDKVLFEGMEFKYTIREGLEKDTKELIEGLLLKKGDDELIELIKKRGRLGNLKAANYVEEFDLEKEEQFSAITYQLEDGLYYIAFRGTDNSVIGWKEDFNLSYQEQIPAQKDAIDYAANMMKQFPGRYYIGGHSKGGNLAVYTAMNLQKEMRERIVEIHNFDGPGFAKKIYESEEYQEIRARLIKIVPESAVVGMLWEEDTHYRVVKSKAEGLVQHNPLTWCIDEKDFVYLEEVDEFAKFFKRTFDAWLKEHDFEAREQIVDTVFDVIYGAGIVSFKELTEQKRKKIEALLESLHRSDSEEKKTVAVSLKKLLEISTEEMKQIDGSKVLGKFGLRPKKLSEFKIISDITKKD